MLAFFTLVGLKLAALANGDLVRKTEVLHYSYGHESIPNILQTLFMQKYCRVEFCILVYDVDDFGFVQSHDVPADCTIKDDVSFWYCNAETKGVRSFPLANIAGGSNPLYIAKEIRQSSVRVDSADDRVQLSRCGVVEMMMSFPQFRLSENGFHLQFGIGVSKATNKLHA